MQAREKRSDKDDTKKKFRSRLRSKREFLYGCDDGDEINLKTVNLGRPPKTSLQQRDALNHRQDQ